jgi:hypothetical protein
MLPILRRFIAMFCELEMLHGHRLLAAYTDILHEAQALLRKVDGMQKKERSETTAPPPEETQNVMDFPHRHGTIATE